MPLAFHLKNNKQPVEDFSLQTGYNTKHAAAFVLQFTFDLVVNLHSFLIYLLKSRGRRTQMNIEHENAKRRAVEALAQAIYESQNPGGIAWAKRTLTVREPWLVQARRQLQVSAPRGTLL